MPSATTFLSDLPLAITQEALPAFQAGYYQMKGASGRRSSSSAVPGGVSVVPLAGFLVHGRGPLEKFREEFASAMANSQTKTVVIWADSAGGGVEGISEVSRVVFGCRARKRTITVVDPLLAAGGYWIGSAAHEVVVTPSGRVGGLGIIAVHQEVSKAEEAQGIRSTVFKSGRFKGEGNPHEPLTTPAARHLQEMVDDYQDLLVDDISRNRRVTPRRVIHGMGQGRVLTAETAVYEGLADRVATMDQVLEELGVRRRLRA